MTVANLIEKNGLDKIQTAVILAVGGDAHTGSHSYWIDGAKVDFGKNGEYADVEVIRELPGNIFIDAENCIWRIKD